MEGCPPESHYYPLNVIDIRTKPDVCYLRFTFIIKSSFFLVKFVSFLGRFHSSRVHQAELDKPPCGWIDREHQVTGISWGRPLFNVYIPLHANQSRLGPHDLASRLFGDISILYCFEGRESFLSSEADKAQLRSLSEVVKSWNRQKVSHNLHFIDSIIFRFFKFFNILQYSRPSFFGALRGLEGGCLRFNVKVGDCLVMPAQYLHFVLTKGSFSFFISNC